MLNVPYYKQDLSYTCGAACAQMVLAYYGIHESEAHLADELGTDSLVGTRHEALIHLFSTRGLYSYVNSDSSLEEASYLVDNGAPAIVNFTYLTDTDGHYAVLTGVNQEHVYLNDPLFRKNKSLDADTFELLWHDKLLESRRWLLAVSPKPFLLGKQYYPAHAVAHR
jgi:ABC-type bacteriocin/lantibiotic exporter with double-glycine peptidase domain